MAQMELFPKNLFFKRETFQTYADCKCHLSSERLGGTSGRYKYVILGKTAKMQQIS